MSQVRGVPGRRRPVLYVLRDGPRRPKEGRGYRVTPETFDGDRCRDLHRDRRPDYDRPDNHLRRLADRFAGARHLATTGWRLDQPEIVPGERRSAVPAARVSDGEPGGSAVLSALRDAVGCGPVVVCREAGGVLVKLF